jgi:hypothetical protein
MDYEEFDKVLMGEIWAGRNTMAVFTKESNPVRIAVEWYRKRDPWRGRTPVVRIIERRLQALRQEGRIKWSGRAWEITDGQK